MVFRVWGSAYETEAHGFTRTDSERLHQGGRSLDEHRLPGHRIFHYFGKGMGSTGRLYQYKRPGWQLGMSHLESRRI